MITIYPAAGAILSALFLLKYKLSEGFMDSVSKDLDSRRK